MNVSAFPGYLEIPVIQELKQDIFYKSIFQKQIKKQCKASVDT